MKTKSGMLYQSDQSTPTEPFAECWRAAGRHLNARLDGIGWLRAHLHPPFLEHLSFQIGNQIFFVRIEPREETIGVPGSRSGLLAVAEHNNGHACVMPMTRRASGWIPEIPDWGLSDVKTGDKLNPAALITDELIEMTDWELHGFAVECIHKCIKAKGSTILQWHGYLADPSLWFLGPEGPEWVVVRAVRYPETNAALPSNWNKIAADCEPFGRIGHFASVGVWSAEGPNPLWRGHGMHVRFTGLRRLTRCAEIRRMDASSSDARR